MAISINIKALIRLFLLFILICAIIFALINYRDQINLHALRETLRQYGSLAPLVFIGIYIAATVLFLPGTILTITGGLLFGAFWGTLYNIIGATTGATLAFVISRYIASDWIRKKAGPRIQLLLKGVEREGWRFVAVLRLVPLIPFNLLNYALGLTPISVLGFITASAIFMLPAAFAYTYIGSLGETFIYGSTREIIAKVFIAVGLLILLAAIPLFIRRIRKNNKIK